MIKAVIFDLDGVIADSEPLHEESERKVFSKFGVTMGKEDFAMSKGRAFRDVVRLIAKKYKKEIDVEEAVIAKYEILTQSWGKVKMYPGVIELLKRLEGFKLAVATGSLRPFAEAVLDSFLIKDAFDVLVTASDFEKGKPDPEPFLMTVNKLGLRPEECVVVEDSVNGVISAKDAGASTIAITTTFGKKEFKIADVVVDSLDEIDVAMIKDLGESYE